MVQLPGLPSPGVVLSPGYQRYYARLRLPLGWPQPGPRRASPVPCGAIPTFRILYAGGFLTAALPSASPLPWPSPRKSRLGSLLFRLSPGKITARQISRDATDCRFASLPSEDIVSGLRRPDFAGFVSSSPLSYSGRWVATEAGLSPASPARLAGHTFPVFRKIQAWRRKKTGKIVPVWMRGISADFRFPPEFSLFRPFCLA